MSGPDWIRKAERVARAFRAATVGASGATHNVYVILMHDPSRAGRWGLYVGQTSRDPTFASTSTRRGTKRAAR